MKNTKPSTIKTAEESDSDEPIFVGRKDLLQEIEQWFNKPTAGKAYLLLGNAGAGKTQLAWKYLQNNPLFSERNLVVVDNFEEGFSGSPVFTQRQGVVGLLTSRDTRKSSNEFSNIVLASSQVEQPVLTAKYLSENVAPLLSAISEMQYVMNMIQKRENSNVKITFISQQSPISVSLDGASQTLQTITEMVVPWRRKHAEEMARLSTLEKQAEIESIKADVLEKRAKAEKERGEIIKQRHEAERLSLENEKLRMEIQKEKVQLVLDILTRVAPNLSETERMTYFVRLLPSLDIITSSELEITKFGT